MKRLRALRHDKVLANIYTAQEAAEYLGLSLHGVRYHVREGNLEPDTTRFGNALLFTRTTLNEFRPRKPGAPPKERVLDRWATAVEIQILFEDRNNRRWVRGHSGRSDGIAYTYLQIMGKPEGMSWETFTDLSYEVGEVLEQRGVLIPDERELKGFSWPRRPDMRRVDTKWIRTNKKRLKKRKWRGM